MILLIALNLQDQSDLDITDLLGKLVSHQTGPRDIEEILSEMSTLLDTRNYRREKYMAQKNESDVDNEDLADALGDLSEATSCNELFRMVFYYFCYDCFNFNLYSQACNNILFEPKSIQSVSLSAVPTQNPEMDEFIEKHLGK